MNAANAIGIDLGATSTLAAVMTSGTVEVIPNSDGDLITENCVGFTEYNVVVGAVARNPIIKPTNFIFDVKKLLGRTWDDPVLQKCLHYLPYDIINDNSEPKIRVECKREICLYTPEEILSFVLTKLKDSAEMKTDKLIRKVVITVPTHFQEKQRIALKKAATIAGLRILDFLLEPIAAVIAYKLDTSKEKKVFVFDFGSAKLSASVVLVKDGNCKLMATGTNIYVGGNDFDDRLFIELVKVLKKKHNFDVSENQTAQYRLRKECRRIKRFLSNNYCEDVCLESLYQNIDFNYSVSRHRFEYMNRDLFEAVSQLMQQVLEDAKLNADDIDDVVLAGSTTRIPKVRELLNDMFKEKDFHNYIWQEQVMVEGAARYAAILDNYENTNNRIFVSAIDDSLGVETAGGLMDVIIPRLAVPPIKRSKIYTTFTDNQPAITVRVFQGEKVLTGKNRLLSKLEFWLPSVPKGMPQVEITFKIDHNNLLTVTVEDKFAFLKKSIKIEEYGLNVFMEECRLEMLNDYEDEDRELRKEVTNAIEYILPKKVVLGPKVVNLG